MRRRCCCCLRLRIFSLLLLAASSALSSPSDFSRQEFTRFSHEYFRNESEQNFLFPQRRLHPAYLGPPSPPNRRGLTPTPTPTFAAPSSIQVEKFRRGRFHHNRRRNYAQRMGQTPPPLLLPTFTYPDTPARLKQAANAHGRRVRTSHLHVELQMNLDEAIARDKEAYASYYQKFGYEFELLRRVFYRAEYAKRTEAIRRERLDSLIVLCYDECKAHVARSFPPLRLPPSGNPGLVAWLERMEMKAFLATLLSLPLSTMQAIRRQNCPQWEAKFQCLYACTGDLQLISKFKKLGLSGDAYLTVNQHCPKEESTTELPCLTTQVERWLLPCEPHLLNYERRVKAQEEMSVDRESDLCQSYRSLLTCTLPRLRRFCSLDLARLLHTSLTASFTERRLRHKRGGSEADSCTMLSDQAELGL